MTLVRRPALRLSLCLLLTMVVSVFAQAEVYRFATKWGSNGTGDGQFAYPKGIAVDASGNAYVADYGNHRIQKFTSTGAFLTKWGSYGSGDGQFAYPMGVAVDASGNVYVADLDNHRIQKFTSTGTFVAKWGSQGSDDGQLDQPAGVALGASGNVYVTELGNDRIQKFTPTGAFLAKWGSSGSGDGQFYDPHGVAVDASGNVYVVDTMRARVQKFTSAGTYITKWGGSYGTGDGEFRYPVGVAVDASGNVCVVDRLNHRMQNFTPTGAFITKWGSSGSDDGQFDSPSYAAVDASGNVYVVDEGNHRIQKFHAPPSLEWVGVTGYMSDGVEPDTGRTDATFTFKARYTDVLGSDPIKARCFIYRRVGPAWRFYRSLRMTRGSGDVSTGAVYKVSRPLTNQVWRYKFHFQDSDGGWVSNSPACFWQQGPEITGAPRVHWCGREGYTVDGVHPNSGLPGAKFTFKVMYHDSDGQAPDSHELVIRRNGDPYKTKALVEGGGIDYRLGRIYWTSVTLPRPGSYKYRFRLTEGGKQAKGAPAEWRAGPSIGESAGLIASGLSSMPTNAGAQLTFTLSSSANVTARVLNVAGRPVKTICADRPSEAGANTLLWNAMSDRGTRVPNGIYLLEVAARAEDGSQARALTRVRVER